MAGLRLAHAVVLRVYQQRVQLRRVADRLCGTSTLLVSMVACQSLRLSLPQAELLDVPDSHGDTPLPLSSVAGCCCRFIGRDAASHIDRFHFSFILAPTGGSCCVDMSHLQTAADPDIENKEGKLVHMHAHICAVSSAHCAD